MMGFGGGKRGGGKGTRRRGAEERQKAESGERGKNR